MTSQNASKIRPLTFPYSQHTEQRCGTHYCCVTDVPVESAEVHLKGIKGRTSRLIVIHVTDLNPSYLSGHDIHGALVPTDRSVASKQSSFRLCKGIEPGTFDWNRIGLETRMCIFSGFGKCVMCENLFSIVCVCVYFRLRILLNFMWLVIAEATNREPTHCQLKLNRKRNIQDQLTGFDAP